MSSAPARAQGVAQVALPEVRGDIDPVLGAWGEVEVDAHAMGLIIDGSQPRILEGRRIPAREPGKRPRDRLSALTSEMELGDATLAEHVPGVTLARSQVHREPLLHFRLERGARRRGIARRRSYSRSCRRDLRRCPLPGQRRFRRELAKDVPGRQAQDPTLIRSLGRRLRLRIDQLPEQVERQVE